MNTVVRDGLPATCAGDTPDVFQNLAAFVVVSAVVICVAGPDTALIVRNTLTAGRAGGIATAVEIIGGVAIWTLAVER